MHKKSSVIGNWYLGIWIFFITCLMKLLSSDLLQEVLKKRMIKKKNEKNDSKVPSDCTICRMCMRDFQK